MLKQGDEFEDIEAEPLLIRLSRQSLCLAPNQRRTRAFLLWAAAICFISCYASLHLHLFGENNLNQKKTFSNTVPTAPMPSTRSISAAKNSHSTIYTQFAWVE